VAADQDAYGDCTGNCDECNGVGACRGDNTRCSGTTGSCYCSGSGTAYNCQTCPDSFGVCGDPTCTSYSCGNAAYVAGTDCGGLCQSCNGAGSCVNTASGSDYQNECPGAFGTCAGANCNGAGACQYLAAGQQSCGACNYCTGSSFSCSNVASGSDPYNVCTASWTGCSGSCTKTGTDGNCDGSGACAGATANVAAGNICSSGSEVAGVCNNNWACSNAQNADNAYNNGGTGYWTQGQCDGSGNCDLSGPQGNADDSSTACTCVKGSGYWGIGGEVDSSGCCSDDSGENKKTRVCSSGACTSDSTDDACCDASSDCIYTGTCYSSGSMNGNIRCSAGSWTTTTSTTTTTTTIPSSCALSCYQAGCTGSSICINNGCGSRCNFNVCCATGCGLTTGSPGSYKYYCCAANTQVCITGYVNTCINGVVWSSSSTSC